ncbi:MAG: ribosome-associated translation inhibitor RaiA [Bacteroidota bacterium]
MKVKIHSIRFDADNDLLKFIKGKIDKLKLFNNQIINSEVFLRVNKSSKTDNKVAEIRINVPGKELFAKKQGKSFEEATDAAVEALRRQLKKHKEKFKRE